MPNKNTPKRSITIAKKITQLMLDKKAASVDIIDVRKLIINDKFGFIEGS